MGIIIIGETHTKRADYFLKAAEQENVDVSIVSVEDICIERLEGSVVKLDPPSFVLAELENGVDKLTAYQNKCRELLKVSCRWLNTPGDILLALDKFACKKRLQEAGISVSPMFTDEICSLDTLYAVMDERNTLQVFVKPRFGSGAAGVMAYRRNRDGRKQQLFTSCILEDGKLVNTKKMRKFEKKEDIEALLSANIALGVVVEKWIPKAMYQKKSYDLRVVWQFGKRAFCIARTAKGPVTNLHLNNGALELKELGLTREEMQSIDRLCEKTMEQFTGLSVAGIDIALDKNNHKPFVIEVNGQGDLLYQDIYGQNSIYREQVREMAKWDRV